MSRFILNSIIFGVIMAVMIIGTTMATGTNTNTGRNGLTRTNRASFRNSQLSTARGFGKRDPGSLVANSRSASAQALAPSSYEGFLPVVLDSSRTNYPNSWLVDELQNNPEVARFVVERLVDENGDGELTPGELTRRQNYY